MSDFRMMVIHSIEDRLTEILNARTAVINNDDKKMFVALCELQKKVDDLQNDIKSAISILEESF